MRAHHSNTILAAVGCVVLMATPRTGLSQDSTAQPAPAGGKTGPTAVSVPAVSAPNAEATPSPAEIAAWVVQLDDRQYRVRETATQRLLSAGSPALAPLAAVASGDRPEPADRAVWVLQQFGNSKEPQFRRAALERLAQLKNRPQVVAAASDALALIRHKEARQAIVKLGGRFAVAEFPGIDPRAVSIPLILDENWKGKHEDLALLNQVLGLRRVYIIGTELTSSDVAELRNVPALDELNLYGTRLEPKDLAEIKLYMPQANIEYRRGGLMGVSGNRFDDGQPARAEMVQPGSAAAQAGIQVGDVIRRFDGEDVKSFRDLTDKISNHRPGDEVAIEIVRNGATKKITLKLGQWSADNVIKQIAPP